MFLLFLHRLVWLAWRTGCKCLKLLRKLDPCQPALRSASTPMALCKMPFKIMAALCCNDRHVLVQLTIVQGACRACNLSDASCRSDERILVVQVAILKKLRAENIVRFLGVCVQDSKTMLVTEFMQGGDLFNRLTESAQGGELAWHNQCVLPLNSALSFTREIWLP